MDDGQAKAVAQAHTRASPGRGYFASVKAACSALLPEKCVAAVHKTADGSMPLIYAADAGTIFRLEVQAQGPGPVADIEVRRFALKDAEVSVAERVVAQDAFGDTVRNRVWRFVIGADRGPLVFETQEADEGPTELERFARAAADACGWPVSDKTATEALGPRSPNPDISQ